MALIAGGGIAGLVQGSTVALRAKSSLATAGAGNPIFSTFELAGATLTGLMAVFMPILCLILIALICIWVLRKGIKYLWQKFKGAKAS